MKITLAYPWQGHQPDETVEVDDATGRAMLSGGRARTADGTAPQGAASTQTPRATPRRATRSNRKRT